jgi:hypothetical protein
MGKTFVVLLTLLGLTNAGCFIPYMMIRGTSQPVQLASNPQGATASVSTGSSCQTPCDIELPRASSVVITFSKAGCKQQLVSVFPTISGGGMLWGGVFGEMSGADYDLQPNPAVANLDCVEQVPVAATQSNPIAPAVVAAAPAPAIAQSAAAASDHR